MHYRRARGRANSSEGASATSDPKATDAAQAGRLNLRHRLATSSHAGLAWPVRLLLLSIFLPVIISVGSLNLPPFRLLLSILVVPCLIKWSQGKAGPVRFPDIAILLYCVWATIALIANHGLAFSVQPSGSLIVETAGGYFVARCYIRDEVDFRNAIRWLFWSVAILCPFAVIESITHHDYILEIVGKLFTTHPLAENEPRWGLRRVQSVFEHPILFGVSTGAIFALVHLVLGAGQTAFRRWLKSGIVVVAAFFSLSSGPLSALTAQIMLVIWGWLMRNNKARWRMLWFVALTMYVAILTVSNQSVPEFLMTHFAFDEASAYYRVLIWKFGSESALNHPILGVGFNRWDRPSWMPPSIDMFWLLQAVYYGIPAGLLMILTFFSVVFKIGFRSNFPERLEHYRVAYLCCAIGYFLVGWTVHFWNGTYVLFLFLLSGGIWMLDVPGEATPSAKSGGRRGSRAVGGGPARAKTFPVDAASPEDQRRGLSQAGAGASARPSTPHPPSPSM